MLQKELKTLEEYTIKSTGVKVSENDLSNGVFNVGNRSKIIEVMRKAMRGEDVVLCCFGGSITAGGNRNAEPVAEAEITHSLEPTDYVAELQKWWDNLFSKYGSKVTMVNAGIGATDTPYGTHRIVEDVLPYNPDLVIMDWCCNDNTFPHKQGTYESLIRKLIRADIGVILFSFDQAYHGGTQKIHEPLSLHYNIPHLSYYNAFGGHEKWEYLTNDKVHPNRVGHVLSSLIITNYLGRIYSNIDNISDGDFYLREDTYHPDADAYNGAYIARISDILANKIDGVHITDIGSFVADKEERSFAFKKYLGYVAYSNETGEFKPLVVEIDKCKTAFILIARSNGFVNGNFDVIINDQIVEDKDGTFNCSIVNSVDNMQIEWQYHWATQRACYFKDGEKVTMKIMPKIPAKQEKAYVKLYALLLS